jgi:hypothetical protein
LLDFTSVEAEADSSDKIVGATFAELYLLDFKLVVESLDPMPKEASSAASSSADDLATEEPKEEKNANEVRVEGTRKSAENKDMNLSLSGVIAFSLLLSSSIRLELDLINSESKLLTPLSLSSSELARASSSRALAQRTVRSSPRLNKHLWILPFPGLTPGQ